MMGYEVARELAWDLAPAIKQLVKISGITYQEASYMLLDVFNTWPEL